MKKTYNELKNELQEVLAWFEQDDLDVDQAIAKHAEAEKLIKELQTYLEATEQKIKKIKSA